MKKRYQNILKKTEKKNGWSVFLCAIVLSMGFGVLSGCTFMKESSKQQNADTAGSTASDDTDTDNRDSTMADTDTGDSMTENTDTDAESGMTENAGDSDSNDSMTENLDENAGSIAQMAGNWKIDFDVTDPTLWGTGISYGCEMKITQTGDFSYYIGIGNGGTGQCEVRDGKVTVEIVPYEEHSSEPEILTLSYENINGSEQILMDWHGENVYWKRSDDAQGVPGAEDNSGGQEVFNEDDVLELRKILEEFSLAYFNGDTDTLQNFLTDSCEREVYQGTGSISDMQIKGLNESGPKDYGNGEYGVSLEFRDSSYPDTLQYLEILLVKQDNGWKISFYGLSG